jgi:hypothetical protein
MNDLREDIAVKYSFHWAYTQNIESKGLRDGQQEKDPTAWAVGSFLIYNL